MQLWMELTVALDNVEYIPTEVVYMQRCLVAKWFVTRETAAVSVYVLSAYR